MSPRHFRTYHQCNGMSLITISGDLQKRPQVYMYVLFMAILPFIKSQLYQ